MKHMQQYISDRNILFPVVVTCLLLAGCASPRVVTVETPVRNDVPGTTLSETEQGQVRNPEIVKGYVHGPYIDPADGNTRYNGGTMERVEQSATWNMRPTESTTVNLGPATSVSDPAEVTNPMTAEFEQQLEKQQRLMAAMAEQNTALAQTLQVVNQELEAAKKERETTVQLKQEVDSLKEQLMAQKKAEEEAAKKPQKSWWQFGK